MKLEDRIKTLAQCCPRCKHVESISIWNEEEESFDVCHFCFCDKTREERSREVDLVEQELETKFWCSPWQYSPELLEIMVLSAESGDLTDSERWVDPDVCCNLFEQNWIRFENN